MGGLSGGRDYGRTPRVVIDGRVIDDHFPGIGRYVYKLVDALGALEVEPDFEVRLLHRPGQRDARYRLSDLERHPRVRLAALDAPVFGLASQWRIPAALRALDASVYHATYWMGAWRSGRPSLLSLYDLIGRRVPGSVPGLERRALSLLLRLAIRDADALVTISEAARSDILASGLTRVPVTVTPLAADERFRPADPARTNALRQRLDLPENMVLYLGINKPHKNLETLIRAWGRLPEIASGLLALHQPELVIAGRWDPRYDHLRALAGAQPAPARIRFLGPVDEVDLPLLYSAARVFAFPSRYEGFGLPPLEAMACGTAVVAAAATSLPEVVGDAGLLVDPDDVDAWARALASLLADPERRAALAAKGLARSARFSWEATARGTLEVYRSLAACYP